MNKYRFVNGSLYKLDSVSNSYVHCFKCAYCDTKRKAINQYELGREFIDG